MIGIVVPTKRPHLMDRVRQMARAQGPSHTLIPITGDGPPGVLRNQGTRVARELGIKIVSFWDDDDFYGPGYLDEQLAAWEPGRVVGKTFGFVAFNKGVVYFPTKKECATQHLLIGGTILGHVDQIPDFTDMPVGEDGRFAADCRKVGLETYVTSGGNFVYSRLGDKRDHTFKAGDALVWLAAGGEGCPTPLSPEEAMSATPSESDGRVVHKEWADGDWRERPRVPHQAQA